MFSVRKCTVKPKEKIMRASYGEINGFSAVGAEALMLVNGGKASSGSSDSTGSDSNNSDGYCGDSYNKSP
jgi:hypothetical protein